MADTRDSAGAAGGDGPDMRVARALEATGTPYRIAGAFFSVTITYPAEGRSQMVLISSRTQSSGTREWRKVWSEAFDVAGTLSWEQAMMLLKKGDNTAFGGWYVSEDAGRSSVNFQASVPADAWPAELEDAILMVAEAADDMEKAVLGTDAN